MTPTKDDWNTVQTCELCGESGTDVSSASVEGEDVMLCRPCNNEVFLGERETADAIEEIEQRREQREAATGGA